MRIRVTQSDANNKAYSIENSITSSQWPPVERMGNPITPTRCREIMHHLHLQEMSQMKRLRNFEMPNMSPGDLVEVRYELSRTQQTFAVFQGYCIEVRKKRLNSSFILKNTYEGVGVEQLIPRYSPRLLNVRIIKSLKNPYKTFALNNPPPVTRDYRYRWHNNERGKYERKRGSHKPGIRSVEQKIRHRIAKIRRRYMHQRIEANLPPYIWAGPYPLLQRKRSRLIRAETHRRMLLYSLDEQRARLQKIRKRRAKEKWGVFQIKKEPKLTAINSLPSYHPLSGNLPK